MYRRTIIIGAIRLELRGPGQLFAVAWIPHDVAGTSKVQSANEGRSRDALTSGA